MRLYLFDDAAADSWHPFSLTRPCGELLFGAELLRERSRRFAGCPAAGHLSRPWLADFREPDAPPVVRTGDIPREESRLFLSSRFVPEDGTAWSETDTEALLLVGGEPAGRFVPAGRPAPDAAWLHEPTPEPGLAVREIGGRLLGRPWELVEGNPDRLARDLRQRGEGATGGVEGLDRIGEHAVRLGKDVRVEPGTLFDAREGPIEVGDRVEVRHGSRLEGPLFVGRDSRLLGGSFARLSAGPCSYLHGEIEEAVVLGHSNKAHDGFLGHAYLGRWVNLGALTTNSDLKNNYGPVRIGGPDGEVETGLLKLGGLLGDHVKTAIGTLLNTGTVVGAGANLFGGSPPKWVPPFAWGATGEARSYRLSDFLETAERVMSRRGVAWSEETRRWLSAAWEAAG